VLDLGLEIEAFITAFRLSGAQSRELINLAPILRQRLGTENKSKELFVGADRHYPEEKSRDQDEWSSCAHNHFYSRGAKAAAGGLRFFSVKLRED
jgi:hypothetical protein